VEDEKDKRLVKILNEFTSSGQEIDDINLTQLTFLFLFKSKACLRSKLGKKKKLDSMVTWIYL
jgi:hypothetical protein